MARRWVFLLVVVLFAGCLGRAGDADPQTTRIETSLDESAPVGASTPPSRPTSPPTSSGSAPPPTSSPSPSPSSRTTAPTTTDEVNRSDAPPEDAKAHPSDPAVRQRWLEYEASGRLTFSAASSSETLDLELSRFDFFLPDWFYEEDGSKRDRPWIATLEGERVGEPGSSARVVFTDTWVGGVALSGSTTYMLGFGGGGYGEDFDELTGDVPNPFRARIALPPSPPGPSGRVIDEEGPTCDIHPVPLPISPVAPVLGPGDLRLLRVILDADAAAVNNLGSALEGMRIAYLLGVDAVYEREVGVRVQVVGLHHTLDAAKYAAADLPSDFIDYWNTRPEDRDLALLFKWTNPGFVAGQANCIGGAGEPGVAYVFAILDTGSPHQALLVVLHEIAHTFTAHHHYANCVESIVACTIMINDIGLNWKHYFSTVNRSVIRGWADGHLPKYPA